jgi:YgiT-type zinc finger domain-containing protein
MGGKLSDTEERMMICYRCGGKMEERITDLPFKLSDSSIVIIKGLPVTQCSGCGEYLLSDPVMARVEQILESVGQAAELEIVRYAA